MEYLVKGKYNFLIPIFRLIASIAPCLMIYVLIIDFPNLASLWTIFLLVFFIYILAKFIKGLIKHRFSFTLYVDRIVIYDFLFFNSKTIYYNEIRGYSIGEIGTFRFGKFKEIILYCDNGEIYEIVQFCFFNYKDIWTELKRNKRIKCLGKEATTWSLDDILTNPLSRKYKFSDK